MESLDLPCNIIRKQKGTMMIIKIYGIKNCDTMQKAMRWLDKKGISYDFHNYKKQGVDADILKTAIAQHGWEVVINKRGTTWRQLPDDVKAGMNDAQAVKIATDNPSIIKRPLLSVAGETFLGFNEAEYSEILATN